MLEQYIQPYSNYQQDTWSELLPLAEFTYNNTLSVTTGILPFFANKRYHLDLMVHPKWDLASSWAWTFTINLDQLHQEVKEHIKTAQSQQLIAMFNRSKMAQYQVSADSCQNNAPEFKTGSHAFVKVQFFWITWLSRKVTKKYLGPFKVITQVSSHSYTLRLLDSMHAVHPVFHVSMLEPMTPNLIPNWIQLPPPPVEINGEPKYEISEILDSKVEKHCRHCNVLYLICWAGYKGTDEETSWVLASELGNVPKIISDFHAAYPTKPRLWTP